MSKKETFESSLAELEELVQKLEGGSLTLDESIATFEKAVGLVKICNERLAAAEQKVRILTEGNDGTVSDRPFAIKEDEA